MALSQKAGHVHRRDVSVVIRSVESFGARNLKASEAPLEAFGGLFGTSWGFLGHLLEVCRGIEQKTFGGLLGTFWEAFWEHLGDLLGTFWGSGARLEENAL